MNELEKEVLKKKIDQASLVSFDIFDTLLFRKTNTPETVFDLVGKHFGIHGFRKLRMDEQDEASRRTYALHQYPHADMDEIYDVLREHTEIPVDWNEVKEFEIQLEQDALTANEEMLEIFRYVKAQGKRVVATSDMYLQARILKRFLEANGFVGFDHVYCSADEHTAKFNKKLFETVAEKEQIPYEQILHIGDKERDDGEYPAEYGMQTFVYHRDAQLDKLKSAGGSDVDKGLYKILYNKEKGFWYNLGVEVGGPIYMGLYQYLAKKAAGKKIYFLSRDGYNLYHIFKELGYQNIEYVYTSRRALMMASICEMNERALKTLPPHTFGQTVGEILDYLCVDRSQIHHLKAAGFETLEDVIRTPEDSANFRKLYLYDKEVFLEQCRKEREAAKKYFSSIGFLEQEGICFDCGWQGSSQELIEAFKKAIGCKTSHRFVYFGIKNGEKSRKQLHGMHYDTYLFDFYKNYGLQEDLNENVVMYELFFSASHESVYYYGEDGTVIFEDGDGDHQKEEMLEGILAFIKAGLEFVEKYDVEYTPELAVGHLKRLILQPTEEEAVTIGNLQNVDGFARKQGVEKYIAFLTKERLEQNFNYDEVYWLKGLLKRPDVDENVKKICAKELGYTYPEKEEPYHLEDGGSIIRYRYWTMAQKQEEPVAEYSYRPKFSVVIPVYNTVTQQLEECIESVLAQTYQNFELILVDDHSTWDTVVPVLRQYEANEHVRVICRSMNGHISKATNDGIFVSDGDFIVFMDCDDIIEPIALQEFAKKLNENPKLDFIYSDEDKITEDGKIRHMPFFKPDWSPDLFLNMMYTNHLATYRASIVKAVGGLRTAYNGSQDYDFTLRFMEQSDNRRVGHVSKILYHWRERKESVAFALSSKNYASEAARYAKEDYIHRNHLNAEMECITKMSQYRIVYHVTGEPLVSIIIPSKDQPEVLKTCIDSIREFTAYRNYEIIVVDNGSTEKNEKILKVYLEAVGAVYVYDQAEFNFSKMCNTGAQHAKGEYLLFLNDDIEIFQPDWLERMLGQAQQPHTGAVGAKLFYPETTLIQHSGICNPQNGPMHNFLKCDDQAPFYFGFNWVDYNCIAVTGACLMTAKKKFEKVGGFDEAFPVAYNDVKLCFALHEKGYYNVIRNDVAAYHHESLSRGTDILDEKKRIRLNQERTALFAEYPELKNRDPYHSRHLKVLGSGLQLQQDYVPVQELDLTGCEPFEEVYFDNIKIGERIEIDGWCILDGEEHMEELERYIVFEDSYGKTYGVRTVPKLRRDVSEYLGNDVYDYIGFESALQRSDLRIDLMVHRLGVMVIGRDGRRYLKWCRNIEISRERKQERIVFEQYPITHQEYFDRSADCYWKLDTCEYEDSCWKIRGAVFKKGWDHYRYETHLLLAGINGTAYELDIQSEERLDVACQFPQEHFLYHTGFVGYVFDRVLEPGMEYEVVLRLKNQFDSTDIYDIRTRQMING